MLMKLSLITARTCFKFSFVRHSFSSLLRNMSSSTVVLPLRENSTGLPTDSFLDLSSKMYELRTYSCLPKDFRKFLHLVDDLLYIRTNHSKLFGFWSTELGGMNEVIHMWEYDSYEHRTNVRKGLADDVQWQEQFMAKAAPMWIKQENSTLIPFSWSNIEKPSNTGVYEIQTYTMNSQPDLWEARLRSAVEMSSICLKPLNSLLIGVFFTIFGQQNSVVALWQHESFDKCAEGRLQLLTECSRSTIHSFYHEVLTSYSRALIPLKCSPMQ